MQAHQRIVRHNPTPAQLRFVVAAKLREDRTQANEGVE
jgi:hypothetical protein